MQLDKLFSVQQELNERIVKEHSLDPHAIRKDKFLALLVELGELANETRCFKYWSTKPPAPREKILEEYVDCLHFILTLGLDAGFTDIQPQLQGQEMELTSHFINMFLGVNELLSVSSRNSYEVLMEDFYSLGLALGFNGKEVEAAYMAKNEINHQRQDEHY